MEVNILEQYYKGILGQLNSEVQLINKSFSHNGLKGEGNENVLKDLLKKFIPKKYGIGSGIVIDKNGKQSRQCDIIIYDNHNYPELLSMSSVKIYPVDLVYAVIEVKTTLDAQKSKLAIQNIESVLSLDYLRESFRVNPIEPVKELNLETVLFQTEETKPPLGFVFAYETDTNDIETFLNWFKLTDNTNFNHFPNHVCSLDLGVLVLKSHLGHGLPLVYPIVKGEVYQAADENEKIIINGKTFYLHKENYYPFAKIGTDEVLVDQAKTLLNFILMLTRMLQLRFTNPNLDLSKHYLSEDLKVAFTLQDGRLAVIRNK